MNQSIPEQCQMENSEDAVRNTVPEKVHVVAINTLHLPGFEFSLPSLSFPSSATMKLLKSLVFFLLLLVVSLTLTGLSHARSLSREVGRWKSSQNTVKTSMHLFPRISPSPEPDDDFSSSYGASKRMVPQGPNPLHN